MNLWEAYDKIDNYLNGKLLSIPPYPCVSGKKIQELLNCLNKPDPAWGGLDGEIIRMVTNPWQRAYQIEYRFKPSKIFKSSINVIESSTYDLMIGNYICSYVSLVPVVEAILRQWASEIFEEKECLNKKGHFSIFIFEEKLIKYLIRRNHERKSNPKFQNWINNQIKHFDYIIKQVFYLNFTDSKNDFKREFNRNRVLHLMENIENMEVLRDNNVRIYLLLDIIAELYLSFDDILYAENTFDADYEDNIDFNLRWKIYLKNAMESINFTDMTIIQFAFFNIDDKLVLPDDKKKKFIEQKDYQIEFLKNRPYDRN